MLFATARDSDETNPASLRVNAVPLRRDKGDSVEMWQFLDSGSHDGATNMAIDVALQELVGQGKAGATVHVYDWSPPAVSIGRLQRIDAAVDMARCRADGIDVVRRPTGGRAVLHEGDFTFSVIAQAGERIPAKVGGSYRLLAEVTALALGRLGIALEIGPPGRPSTSGKACFAASTTADLLAAGRKLVGAAQLWRKGVLLQQHSILVEANQERLLRYLRCVGSQQNTEPEAKLREETCSVRELLGRVVPRATIIKVLAEAVSEVFAVEVAQRRLSTEELSEIVSLAGPDAVTTARRSPA